MHHARVFTDSYTQVFTDSHTQVFTDFHHTMRCPCLIKTVIDGLHRMILFKTKVMFYKPKFFGCHFSNDHFIYKTLVSFMGSIFLESHHRLRKLSTLFGLSPSECNTQILVFHLMECLALLTITQHMFSVSCNRATLLDFVQQYWAHSSNHQLLCLILTMHPYP